VAAIVSDVNCFEGQQVEKGQTLFTLNNIRKPDGSIEQALLKITAPLSGTVVYVNVRPGEVTDPETQTPLVELVDLNRLIIAANVPSSQMPALKVGQTVEIVPQQAEVHNTFATTETAAPNPAPIALTGKVALIEDRVDPKTDMGPVDISVPPKAGLRPGQFVRVRIITEERRDCLTVPSRSIVKNQSGEWVICLVSGKQAIQQPVKVGFREGDMVQIHSLILQPGDKVVTTGAYGLPEKTKIRILSE
jgi:membrane fusion protein (multidrug efflux system)